MSRGPKKPNITKTVEAVRKAGLEIARVKVGPDGTIDVFTMIDDDENNDELDSWIKKHADQTEGS